MPGPMDRKEIWKPKGKRKLGILFVVTDGLVKKLWKSIRILDQLEQELIFIFRNFFNIMLQLVKIISKNHFLKFRNESSL